MINVAKVALFCHTKKNSLNKIGCSLKVFGHNGIFTYLCANNQMYTQTKLHDMKKNLLFPLMLFASLAVLTACSSDDATDSLSGLSGGGTGNDGVTASSGELSTFTIALDRTTAEPANSATATYTDAADNISTQTFATTVAIDMANPVAKTENGVAITVSDGHVTANHASVEGVCYVVTGTTASGSLTIKGNTAYEVNLNGTDITSPASAALNLDSKLAAYVVLTGTNKLTDGTGDGASQKSALYGKGNILFSGTGSLEVYGKYNNGIHAKGYLLFEPGINVYVEAANHGIKGTDCTINGGILNVQTAGLGAKGINCDNDITINGGRTTVVCTGNGEWDDTDLETKGAAGIKCDHILYIHGGEVYAKATGSGGKGMKADYEAYITGGKIRIITEGGLYYSNGTTENHNYTGNTDNLDDAYTSSPKGIKIGVKASTATDGTAIEQHGVLQITGGDIMVRTSGTNGEGIESKGTLDITGGSVMVAAYDDAINSSSDLTVSGGTVIAVGTHNDGIDANGNLYIKGGSIIAYGASGAEAGIDADESHALYITGGSLFAIGGRMDVKLGSTTQGLINASGSVAANSTVTLTSGSTTLATFSLPPYANTSGTILVTAPGVTSGSSYTLTVGSASASVTASNSISSSMGGGQPGGQPGGPGRW